MVAGSFLVGDHIEATLQSLLPSSSLSALSFSLASMQRDRHPQSEDLQLLVKPQQSPWKSKLAKIDCLLMRFHPFGALEVQMENCGKSCQTVMACRRPPQLDMLTSRPGSLLGLHWSLHELLAYLGLLGTAGAEVLVLFRRSCIDPLPDESSILP